jgi:hypothetical protein
MNATLETRINIADDEPANVNLLEAILGRAGLGSTMSFPDGDGVDGLCVWLSRVLPRSAPLAVSKG